MTLAKRLVPAYRSFLEGRPKALLELLADDVIYHLPGHHLGGGTVHGVRSLLDRVGAAARLCSSPPKVEPLSVASEGKLVITLERFRAESPDAFLDQHVCVVWRFEGSRCAEIWAHFEDQPACDAFWRGLSLQEQCEDVIS